MRWDELRDVLGKNWGPTGDSFHRENALRLGDIRKSIKSQSKNVYKAISGVMLEVLIQAEVNRVQSVFELLHQKIPY